ncbi:ABC transporter permease [Endozoicomonas montiporae]|uniref:Glutathione importing ABC transporter, permease component n=1 Tax=Endozoicomonas montiporae CL-33 TaxID=570277 RepID=A0A142B8L0_9GAMM|nr:ABC transporter permease [Endozoicomonas montiporae]AMO55086.1 glutathione importing ABC transporter, permease component [Endozoicomonas montiporae CL-33]
MIKQILLRRAAQAAFVAWGVGTLTFIMMRLLPGDFAYRIAAGRYGYDYVSQAAAEAVRADLGLDRPAIVQYLEWLLNLLRFNLGDSLVSENPVTQELAHQLGSSLELAVFASFFALLIAVPVGLYAGRHAGGAGDRLSLMVSVILRAQPVFVIGLLMVLAFSLKLGWFPVAGFGSSEYLILPALSLALTLAAISSRMIRNSTCDVLASPFYRFARFKGLTEQQAFTHHASPNIALPVVAFVSIQAINLIEGIVMIESLFSWPGIGHALAHAIFARDVPMIQGAALVMGLIFVAINTVADLIVFKLDPRQREETLS